MRKIKLARLLAGVGVATIASIGALAGPANASPANPNPSLRLVGGHSAGIAVTSDNPTGLPESAEGFVSVVKMQCTGNQISQTRFGQFSSTNNVFDGLVVTCKNGKPTYKAGWSGTDGKLKYHPFSVTPGSRLWFQSRKIEPDTYLQHRAQKWVKVNGTWKGDAYNSEQRGGGLNLSDTVHFGVVLDRGLLPWWKGKVNFTDTTLNETDKSKIGRVPNNIWVKTSATTGGGANFNVRPTAVGVVNTSLDRSARPQFSEQVSTFNASTPPPGGVGEAATSLGYATLKTPTKTKLDTQLPVGKLACNLKKPGSYGTTVWVGDLANHNVSVKTNCVATRGTNGKIRNKVTNTLFVNGRAVSSLKSGAVVVINNGSITIAGVPGKPWATNEVATNTHLYTLEGHVSGNVTSVNGWVELPVQKENVLQQHSRNAKLTKDANFGHLKLGA